MVLPVPLDLAQDNLLPTKFDFIDRIGRIGCEAQEILPGPDVIGVDPLSREARERLDEEVGTLRDAIPVGRLTRLRSHPEGQDVIADGQTNRLGLAIADVQNELLAGNELGRNTSPSEPIVQVADPDVEGLELIIFFGQVGIPGDPPITIDRLRADAHRGHLRSLGETVNQGHEFAVGVLAHDAVDERVRLGLRAPAGPESTQQREIQAMLGETEGPGYPILRVIAEEP